MKKLVFLISLLLLLPFEAWTQARKPHSIAELAVYSGPDREQLLYTGAKTEGTVTGTPHSQGVPTKLWRGRSSKISRRARGVLPCRR